MSDTGSVAVERARFLVGVQFRPQGRDPIFGLDCIGLILCAFAIPAAGARRDYRLAGNDTAALDRGLRSFFDRLSAEDRNAGDVILCNVRPGQCHLAVECGGSFVHADARLRRVVETPGAPPWPVSAAYRRKITTVGSN